MRTTIDAIHRDQIPAGPILIKGWIRTKRAAKQFSFIEMTDGSHAKSIQVIAPQSLENYSEIDKLTMGASLSIEGELILSPAKGQKYEIQAHKIEIYCDADPETFPIQKKEMTFEYLREIAHFRPRTQTFSSMFRLRSFVSHAIHDFFRKEGFFYVHTPILTTSDAEGAGESFRVTQFDLNKLPFDAKGHVDFKRDFFESPSMLCVTGQLEAELLAMGMGKVYTFGPTFRAENSNTSRHLAEFWMIEPEAAFFDLKDNKNLAQNMIKYVVKEVLTHCQDELDILAQKAEIDPRTYLSLSLEKPFVEISYTEAISILEKTKKTFEYPVFWGCDLKSEHERFLCEEYFKSPTIIEDYPEQNKAFYMYLNDDQKTVKAMDILVPGIGEMIGGSQREDRESVLLQRMAKKGIPELSWYTAIRKYGGVPHSGYGLGFERLLMWLSGFSNIRDVIPFPRTPGHCDF